MEQFYHHLHLGNRAIFSFRTAKEGSSPSSYLLSSVASRRKKVSKAEKRVEWFEGQAHVTATKVEMSCCRCFQRNMLQTCSDHGFSGSNSDRLLQAF